MGENSSFYLFILIFHFMTIVHYKKEINVTRCVAYYVKIFDLSNSATRINCVKRKYKMSSF